MPLLRERYKYIPPPSSYGLNRRALFATSPGKGQLPEFPESGYVKLVSAEKTSLSKERKPRYKNNFSSFYTSWARDKPSQPMV